MALRIAFLATGWTGYNDAACRELAARPGVEVLVVNSEDGVTNVRFQTAISEYAAYHPWSEQTGGDELLDVVAGFRPDAVVMHSWHTRPYRRVMRSLPSSTLRVVWMDNVWRNIPKQWLGRAVAPVWVRSIFDAAMVPSDRTEQFARMLGFGEGEVIRGSLSADTSLFGSAAQSGVDLVSRARFLACLRLVHHKGADVLADAYARYRDLVDDPWTLRVVGIGPLEDHLAAVEGVELAGFLPPSQVAEEMRQASCLVVPSREEPYGVVLHEGALSALPVISTYFCGATPFFVQDSQNGWTVPGGDADALAAAMARMSQTDPDRLAEMSTISRSLSTRFSSAGWARNLHEQLGRRVEAKRGA